MPSALGKRLNKALARCTKAAADTRLGGIFLAYLAKRRWARFNKKRPELREYLKPYRAPRDLVLKLASEGLSIPDKRMAEAIIFRENYFRFKAYAIPFFDKQAGAFHPNTAFADIHGLYCADQKLRDFLLPVIAQLEVRIRATVDNVITGITGDPFWHINPKSYKNFEKVERALAKAQQRFEQGKQEFVMHYRGRYFTRRSYDFRLSPPFWIISEIFTLEQLLTVCRCVNDKSAHFADSPGSNKLDRAAKAFGLNSWGALLTNLSCLLELRNLCAHHSRLWNRNLQNPAGLKGKHEFAASHPNRLYSHLLMLRVCCSAQGIQDGTHAFMQGMFAAVPVFSRDMANMGFPANWSADKVWFDQRPAPSPASASA